ncbi:MAG TPA: TFIIB-type zinc ribbon-containing protein [Candidatus Aquilonibacter sp.]|nr:TFIIB-type zinc ribbon-containing protein [Candidatus Aquilonibacter sp.]
MRCPKCRKGKLVLDASQAELYCQRCGTVVEEKLADPKTSLFEFDPENVQGARRPTRQPTSWLYPYKDLGTGRKYRASAVEESYARAVGDFQPIWGQLRLPMHVRVYSALLWRRC